MQPKADAVLGCPDEKSGRTRPLPDFSPEAQLRIAAATLKAECQCVCDLHRVFDRRFPREESLRSYTTNLWDLDLAQCFPPIVDYAVALYDAYAAEVLRVPDITLQELEEILHFPLTTHLHDLLVPVRSAVEREKNVWDQQPFCGALRLLLNAWQPYDHPGHVHFHSRVIKTMEGVDDHTEYARQLYGSMFKRFLLRERYWVSEALQARASEKAFGLAGAHDSVQTPSRRVAEDREAIQQQPTAASEDAAAIVEQLPTQVLPKIVGRGPHDERLALVIWPPAFLRPLPKEPIDPELLFRHGRAYAEKRFSENYDTWKVVNTQNPTRFEACGIQTEIRGDALIPASLQLYCCAFMNEVLEYYADYLLDIGESASAALRQFDQFASDLLNETQNHKWLRGMRAIDLKEEDRGDVFLRAAREAVSDVRARFECLAWTGERKRADDALYKVSPCEAPEPQATVGLTGKEQVALPKAEATEDPQPTSAPDGNGVDQRAAEQEVQAGGEARRTKRLRATIRSPIAAQRMEDFMESKGMGLTEFAVQAETTDRTLRTFRQTGRVRRDIFDAIAKAMGTTRESLLKPE